MESIRRDRLASGLRVATEAMPELRSVTIGAWVGSGARDERDPEAGASHFLEHLLFKGTEERTARDIAEAVESVGGEMNAFTTHEQTVFYVRVPDSRVATAVEILADVLWRPAFRPADVEAERQVILDELAMRDDAPEDLVHDVFAEAIFPRHPLGREVIGSEASIGGMTRSAIADYHAAHYRPSNMVLAAAGNLDHDGLRALVAEHFGPTDGERPERPASPPGTPETLAVRERPTEQAHLVVGVRALPQRDPDRYALAVLNQALGGGMSSRLFQEVRETRALAYSIYSYPAAYSDAGFLAVYAGTPPERVAETLEVIGAELDRLRAEGGLGAAELTAAKGHLTGSLALDLETSSARMRRLGRSELVEGEIPTLDEVVARIDAVDPDAVARVIGRLLDGDPPTLAVVGPEPAVAAARRPEWWSPADGTLRADDEGSGR